MVVGYMKGTQGTVSVFIIPNPCADVVARLLYVLHRRAVAANPKTLQSWEIDFGGRRSGPILCQNLVTTRERQTSAGACTCKIQVDTPQV